MNRLFTVLYDRIVLKTELRLRISFNWLLLLISGDINPCPAPDCLCPEFVGFSKKRGLKLIHQNINGLYEKINELRLFLSKTHKNIHIIGITETHCNDSINN